MAFLEFEKNNIPTAYLEKVFKTKIAPWFVALWLFSIFVALPVFPQSVNKAPLPKNPAAAVENGDPLNSSNSSQNYNFSRDVRVEKIPVGNVGAEIITIFINLKDPQNRRKEVPLFSVLRDTLGDNIAENDRLRYVWLLSYVKPSLAQRVASFLPFLYMRTGNKRAVGKGMPPPVADLSPNRREIWDEVFWMAFKNLVINDLSIPARASVLNNRQNEEIYQKSAIERALAILSLYESVEGEKLLSRRELQDIQAKLWMKDKFFGSFLQNENLERAYHKNTEKIRDIRSHNWELLRQYTESQKLYFEPLTMPDGSATHAVVWVAEEDLRQNAGRKFESRFLNIKNPWRDSRLRNWQGYKQTRWYDEEFNEVVADTPGARSKTLIPLALYGLDYPKIPIILVDFRDRYNPKKREISRRVLDDLAKNVLSISKFGNLPYFFGRFFYDFVIGRRGIDVNQASRFRAYSQLKLLLSLNNSLDPELDQIIANRLESVSLNPLENDLDVEINLAQAQYQNLLAAAGDAGKLERIINRDRREEMTALKHNRSEQIFLNVAHYLTFKLYTHREKATPELIARMDLRRQMDFHERFLREVAEKSAQPEVDQNLEKVKHSIDFVLANQLKAPIGSKTVKASARIFAITGDDATRQLILQMLQSMKSPTARNEITKIFRNPKIQIEWRNRFAEYLKLPPATPLADTSGGRK